MVDNAPSLPLSLLRTRQRCSEAFRRLKRSDRREAVRQFEKRFGRTPSLKTPRTWSEKLTCLKLDADRPIFRDLADKLAVRDFVAQRLGQQHLIPLLASNPVLTRDMFEALPEQFVIKSNHGSAMNRIVTDKSALSFKELKRQTDGWLSRNFYMGSRETQYRNIAPQLVVEQLMLDDSGNIPADYKLHCFNSTEASRCIIQVDSDRFNGHCRDYFTTDWQRLPLKVKYANSSASRLPTRPDNLEALIECAKTLSQGFAYVRVDLYSLQGQVYFGEMTFTPESGFGRFEPGHFDEQWGKYFDLEHQLSLHTREDLERARLAQP
ncbi:ATP-grasp fold amidoligase family protein [Kushneria konosiri]|uniref:ATP-grasp fold amidoligase family protein n=1 Tax=Kushneria konosiri TaxID=698828 RepID=UPI001314FA27|nr:ATP-grasp fold amidoligase family protein [Kushneria konosiri]